MGMEKKILLVDDEKDIVDMMEEVLNKEGFSHIQKTFTGADALKLCRDFQPDIVILDIMLPDMDGLEVCRQIREFSYCSVLFLSSKNDDVDKILGLSLGGDDYVTKPFSPSELVARVDSLYRRVAIAEMREENNFQEELVSGDFVLNLRNRALKKKGRMIELTQVEFQIMEYFFSNPGVALDRTNILTHVWGEAYYGEEKIVDVNIRRLRMKIEDEPSNPKHIVTVWGLGYKWEA